MQGLLVFCCVCTTHILAALHGAKDSYPYPFWNPDLPTTQRVTDLVSRLTLAEKVGFMRTSGPSQVDGIARLRIPPYNAGTMTETLSRLPHYQLNEHIRR